MNAEFIEALNVIEKERGVSKEKLIEALEAALISAYRRNYGNVGNARAEVDIETGEAKIYASKAVVEIVEDPLTEVSLENAKRINALYEVGDVIEEEVRPKNFGRIAAQTAKQVVVQRIRETERSNAYDEYMEKETEMLTGIVQRVDKAGVYLSIGRTSGFLDAREIPPGETYETNMRLKVYVLEVRKTNKGPQVFVSRTHPGLVKRLFELEVPEIHAGLVQIKGIAREAGSRTKISVYSNDSRVDAVGACVGQKGMRVERIVEELRREKIDIIAWDPDPAIYIAKSLSPAKVLMVYTKPAKYEENGDRFDGVARVVVPDNQLSLAIGKDGQNARLAVKLTRWKIDIKSNAQMEEEMERMDSGEDTPEV